jgi:hypothetical protein
LTPSDPLNVVTKVYNSWVGWTCREKVSTTVFATARIKVIEFQNNGLPHC